MIRLSPLMAASDGHPDVTVGVIDGPVALDHADLRDARIRELGPARARCVSHASDECLHGTFVAGILVGRRASASPGICPSCTLVLRTIFTESPGTQASPCASGADLAAALVDCVDAGARIVNLSVGILSLDRRDEAAIDEAVRYALRARTLIVAAAGNQGTLSSTVLTRHPWAIPVVAYAADGRPAPHTNVGHSIARNGIGAPGVRVEGLHPAGGTTVLDGTSVAAPFVTGALALLLALFPDLPIAQIRAALVDGRPRGVVPPLLDADSVYRRLGPPGRSSQASSTRTRDLHV
jgi:subtilisin family serine protease